MPSVLDFILQCLRKTSKWWLLLILSRGSQDQLWSNTVTESELSPTRSFVISSLYLIFNTKMQVFQNLIFSKGSFLPGKHISYFVLCSIRVCSSRISKSLEQSQVILPFVMGSVIETASSRSTIRLHRLALCWINWSYLILRFCCLQA